MLFSKFRLSLRQPIVLALLFLVFSTLTKAQYSQYVPDTSFGQNGQLITSVSGQIVRSLVLPDTTILLGGYGNVNGKTRFIVLRLNSNGSFCNLWGNGGIVVDSFYNTDQDQINYMLYLPSEKVLLMGRADSFSTFKIGLSKHLMNGNLDSSFGTNGMTLLPITTNFTTSSMALQANGKIILAGGYNGHMMVCRLNINGSIDSSFGVNGMKVVPIGIAYEGAAAINVMPDDRIVIGGHTYHQAQSWAAVMRFLPNGTLDSSFGTDGHVETNVSGYGDYINNITIQSDGKILASGYNVQQNSPIKLLLIRYDSTGNLDPSFAANGIKQKNINNYDDKSFNTIIQPDGKIVMGGYTTNFNTNTLTDFSLYRVDSFGNDDNSFANGSVISGNYYNNQSNYNDKGQTMSATTGGKLIVAGYSYLSGIGKMSVMQWKPSLITQPTGIDEPIDISKPIIYPNPTAEILNIILPETNETSKIVVAQLLGQKLFEESISPNTHSLKLVVSDFNQGIYLIKWIKENGSITVLKWVKY